MLLSYQIIFTTEEAAQEVQANKKKEEEMSERNPRGQLRPHDGRGHGVGMPGGRRGGRNTGPCSKGGPGFGKGRGRHLGGRKK